MCKKKGTIFLDCWQPVLRGENTLKIQEILNIYHTIQKKNWIESSWKKCHFLCRSGENSKNGTRRLKNKNS